LYSISTSYLRTVLDFSRYSTVLLTLGLLVELSRQLSDDWRERALSRTSISALRFLTSELGMLMSSVLGGLELELISSRFDDPWNRG
jgi:hypothetical protein